jgi:hypothetical protein
MTLQIVPVQSERRILVGEEIRLQFKLCQAGTGRAFADLGSLRVFAYEPSEGRQAHGWAHPVAGGLYETVLPTPAGPCYLFFSCPEAGVGYAHLPHLIIDASASGTRIVTKVPPADRAARSRRMTARRPTTLSRPTTPSRRTTLSRRIRTARTGTDVPRSSHDGLQSREDS